MDSKQQTPLSEVSYNHIPAPMMGVNYVFQKVVYIFVYFKFENIGNNGPFPLNLCIVLCQLHHLI